MKVLSLVELVAAGANLVAEVNAFVEQADSLAFRALVSFFVAYKKFDLTSQQSAERSGAARREELGALNGFSVETDRNFLRSVTFSGYHDLPRIGLLYARQRES
jgi:hypothetical protein